MQRHKRAYPSMFLWTATSWCDDWKRLGQFQPLVPCRAVTKKHPAAVTNGNTSVNFSHWCPVGHNRHSEGLAGQHAQRHAQRPGTHTLPEVICSVDEIISIVTNLEHRRTEETQMTQIESTKSETTWNPVILDSKSLQNQHRIETESHRINLHRRTPETIRNQHRIAPGSTPNQNRIESTQNRNRIETESTQKQFEINTVSLQDQPRFKPKPPQNHPTQNKPRLNTESTSIVSESAQNYPEPT